MSSDNSKLRKTAVWLGIAAAVMLLIMLAARCSAPSVINTGDPAGADTGNVNAAAAGIAALTEWAGEPAQLLSLRWLAGGQAVITGRVGAETVSIPVVPGGRGTWNAPYPPRPAAPGEGTGRETLPAPSAAAEGDERWITAAGFLGAWLTGHPTDRWTNVNYTPPPPGAVYEYEITGTASPRPVPNTPLIVVPVEYTARPRGTGHPPRLYRLYLGLAQDNAGRWVVATLGDLPPPPPAAPE